jgi:hypothetical protein
MLVKKKKNYSVSPNKIKKAFNFAHHFALSRYNKKKIYTFKYLSTSYFPYALQNGIQSRKSNGQNKQVEYNLYIRTLFKFRG